LKVNSWIISVICFVLLYPLTAPRAGVLGDDALAALKSRAIALGIQDIVIDLNARVTVPATPDEPSVDLFATVIRHGDRKLPTILVATPYRREVMGSLYLPLLLHDYNLLAIDIRGTGSSNGSWTSFAPVEHLDTAYVIDRWIPAQPWSDGRVGMVGPSYMGIIQLLAAGQIQSDAGGNPVHLKALFPLVPMSEPYRDIVMHGGNLNLEFIPMWLGLVDVMAIVPPLLALGENPHHPDMAGLKESVAMMQEHVRDVPVQLGWFLKPENMAKSDFYEAKSPMIYWPVKPAGGWSFPTYPYLHPGAIPKNLPVFLVGGWFDIFTRGTLNNYTYGLMNQKAGDKALVMGTWYHIDASMGMELSGISNCEIPARWFDWKIKGKADPFMVTYPVLLYVDGIKRWRAEKSWPLPEGRTTGRTFYLSKKPASLISGDWFSGTNQGKNYRLVEKPSVADYSLWGAPRSNPVLNHDPTSLHGSVSRSSVRWLMGIPALVTQASKFLLGIDMDKGMWYEDERSDEVGVLTFTTEPLDKDTEVCGPLLLSFTARTEFTKPLSSAQYASVVDTIMKAFALDDSTVETMFTKKDVQWVVEVNDVFPDGRARNISSGWLSAGQRPYDPANKAGLDPAYFKDPFDPLYNHGNKYPDPIVDRGTYAYAVEVWPMDNVFKKGHRIRVSISASDFPHLLPVFMPSKNTIVIDSSHQAQIQFKTVKSSGEGTSWKWVDKPSTYLLTHKN
jgi:uncharacterized protein